MLRPGDDEDLACQLPKADRTLRRVAVPRHISKLGLAVIEITAAGEEPATYPTAARAARHAAESLPLLVRPGQAGCTVRAHPGPTPPALTGGSFAPPELLTRHSPTAGQSGSSSCAAYMLARVRGGGFALTCIHAGGLAALP